jgi:hypothetical protein
VTLDGPEQVHIKGADEPVRAYTLIAISGRDGLFGPPATSLVGRRWEMVALEEILDRTIEGRGGVVSVVGPPGIGKSRMARETAALAAGRGVEVIWTFCESHADNISFRVVAQLLRAALGVADLDGEAARTRIREEVPDADAQDLLLLDDLLGIAAPDVALPVIDPDARRRRLTALMSTTALERSEPALFVIEDAHWIDAASESMVADLLAVIPRTPSMVLITARPEYDGALTRLPGAQTIALAPLGDSDTAALLGELLGSDPSVGELASIVAERAAGNPFFAEEMVRELVQRGVLAGERGGYVCGADVADVAVPATVQAAIEARIDRLTTLAKQTLNAASVIGARFGTELLTALGIDPAFDELLHAELVDQVKFSADSEYAFHHPLIRAVAYESQLKSDRATWHRRLATAIQDREQASLDEHAAVIAGHLEAAGELHAAYGWHMRAAAWSTNRDLGAARVNWERARRIADALPADAPKKTSMRISPRMMLCATGWRVDVNMADHVGELAQLCAFAGDKLSQAIGMAGLVGSHVINGRVRDASRLASEQMAMLESLDDPTPTLGLAFIMFANWFDAGEFGEILRWSQTVIDLTGDDPGKGAGFGVSSPLAIALTWRGVARWWLHRPGWRQDLEDAVAMVRNDNAATIVGVLAWSYGLGIFYGVLRADDAMVRLFERAVQTAEGGGDDFMLGVAKYTLSIALLNRDAAADRDQGLELMAQARESFVRMGGPFVVPMADLWAARERARRGQRDAAILLMRNTVTELHLAGRIGYGVWGTGVLVETLLQRCAAGDLSEAEEQIGWLENASAENGSAAIEITLLRLRALTARARGEDDAYRDLVDRYREMAKSLGFEGHIAWAQAMLP